MFGYRKSIRDRSGSVVDREFIATQNFNKNNRLIAMLDGAVNTIKVDPNSFTREDRGLLYTQLSIELSRMFGFRVSLFYEKDKLGSVYTIPTKANSNALVRDVGEYVSLYDSIDTSKELADKDSILIKSREILNTSLSTKGIKVDLNNAKISGLDSNYRNIIMIDIENLVLRYDINGEEIAALLLHEVGHIFNYFRSLEFTSDSTSMLLDDIRNEYLKNKKEPREVLLAYYKKIGGDVGKYKDKNIYEVAVDIGVSVLTSNSRMNIKEEEYSADVFAVRFGLGSALSSAFSKMDNVFIRYNIAETNQTILAGTILSLLLLIIVPFPAIFSLAYTLVMGAVAGLLSYTARKPISASRYDIDSYDSVIDRLSRIKQQMVGSLKYIDDKEVAKSMVEQIDATAMAISKQRNRKGIIDKILRKFNSRKNKLDTHYLVEELLNSDLITAKKRLETLN
jgi:DNA-binding FrmR family transcriptional regulator